MNETTLEEIRQALIDLTTLRSRVVKENDAVGRLFKTLQKDDSPAPTYADLDKAIEELEKKVPGFYVWYFREQEIYALLPRERTIQL